MLQTVVREPVPSTQLRGYSGSETIEQDEHPQRYHDNQPHVPVEHRQTPSGQKPLGGVVHHQVGGGDGEHKAGGEHGVGKVYTVSRRY